MRLIATEEQSDLQAAVRRSMRSGEVAGAVRAALDTDALPFDAVQWQRRCEQIGIAGLLVPEGSGGAGAGMTEAALVSAEMGAAMSGEPFVSTTAAIDTLRVAADERMSDLVARLSGGKAFAGVLLAPAQVELDIQRSTVTGGLPHVLDADGADAVVAHVPGGAVVIDMNAVRAASGGVHVTRVRGLDLSRRLAAVRLERAQCAFLPIPDAVLRQLQDRRGVLFAADSLGVMESMLDSTIDYVKTRTAFGREVGSFQGVKHQLAEIFCTVERSRAVVMAATTALDADNDSARRYALLAQRLVLPAAVESTLECLRLLGGIGYTWEHDAHLQVRRAAANLALAAPQGEIERDLAQLLDVGAERASEQATQ